MGKGSPKIRTIAWIDFVLTSSIQHLLVDKQIQNRFPSNEPIVMAHQTQAQYHILHVQDHSVGGGGYNRHLAVKFLKFNHLIRSSVLVDYE